MTAIASLRFEVPELLLRVKELEEQHLRMLFPAYAAYARAVPKIFPRFTPSGGSRHFQWSLYRRNREYEALAGFLAGVAVLCWKAMP